MKGNKDPGNERQGVGVGNPAEENRALPGFILRAELNTLMRCENGFGTNCWKVGVEDPIYGR